ncbi:MAG: epoxyqueuosine reductase QueH [Bacilli bacterium]|nr:epoxyqueuosine reductase QueH [Bacilli bacterium]
MINYQLKLDEIIKNLDNNKINKLLLHSCCGPCSSYVIEYLSNYFEITVFYYNPNISPKEEYEDRKKEQIKLIQELPTKYKVNFIEGDYDYNKFEEISHNLEEEKEGNKRCSKCYYLRLSKTAIKAAELNFDYFTTTLTVSPYKNSFILNNMGNLLQNKYNVKYLFSDFKKNNGYKRSIELSKQYNLYRQNYCGCIYSKKKEDEYNENKKSILQ